MFGRSTNRIESTYQGARDRFSRGVETARATARGATEATEAATERVAELAERFGELAHDARELASSFAEESSGYARKASREVQHYASELEDASRRNPLATIAIALAVGVAIGYFTRSGR